MTSPQALPALPDSEGGVTQGALTTGGTPGDLSGQFPHICLIGISLLIPHMHCPGDGRVQTGVGPQAAPETSLPFPPPAVLPSYRLSSQKLGTGSGLSSGLSFPLEGEGSGEKGHFPHSAQAHPWWCRRELGGEDLGLGSVSASMELRELHASLLPGLQFSYSEANQVPSHSPNPQF